MKKGQVYIEEHRAGADALDEGKILLHMVKLKNKRLKKCRDLLKRITFHMGSQSVQLRYSVLY
jgi:hypothetical protein